VTNRAKRGSRLFFLQLTTTHNGLGSFPPRFVAQKKPLIRAPAIGATRGNRRHYNKLRATVQLLQEKVGVLIDLARKQEVRRARIKLRIVLQRETMSALSLAVLWPHSIPGLHLSGLPAKSVKRLRTGFQHNLEAIHKGADEVTLERSQDGGGDIVATVIICQGKQVLTD